MSVARHGGGGWADVYASRRKRFKVAGQRRVMRPAFQAMSSEQQPRPWVWGSW
ncbi:uncharacterized protein B0I36DRAFT_313402 [Microdochium trichocladiopsis]|uniref:Uncharacterized protein n=1 Tax=Microdochium trichocladiopsis TaxID=1682393 RepID=A0A9P9BU15_9PEZI|nr:uncharacterized protein B0I36DRAFT_313402 [Microdochium trichocladiopsis]KAH7037136.1 hypothetical protein B0I36DRAFT_313402 [Microdochium trichocladiopsis]